MRYNTRFMQSASIGGGVFHETRKWDYAQRGCRMPWGRNHLIAGTILQMNICNHTLRLSSADSWIFYSIRLKRSLHHPRTSLTPNFRDVEFLRGRNLGIYEIKALRNRNLTICMETKPNLKWPLHMVSSQEGQLQKNGLPQEAGISQIFKTTNVPWNITLHSGGLNRCINWLPTLGQ